ncbi:mannose-1-phosphate guanylyltransferase/mannose-6-phosphate isomerase [Motiliproteus sp. MSK22-1]|uniref:mannose-1-phosphate guanylyltransferase/mannose-6-phosphate isomerase n=1 Tax=Motiliproteus sp. MSK22-1 TaxID=1897630 RepID=UPI00210110B5|nr:mannose-1-phosphate guanylyltransferase/mannose-6-phosphate isomerase [Motiliproteus sp. MSK22-1]
MSKDYQRLLPVIMSGGSGTRLWPASRSHCPKQFLPLVNGTSMIQDTVQRLEGIGSLLPPLVICNDSHRFLVAEQFRQLELEHSGIILEPVGRNTAPAVALAAMHAMREGGDPLLLVLAADHVMKDRAAFHQAVESARLAAQSGSLITFGIVPTQAETGYGYIRAESGTNAEGNSLSVSAFVEKPDFETAQAYVDSKEYYWNSGMFLFSASRYLEELNRFRPDIIHACQQALESEHSDLEFIRLDEKAFASCPDDSIDYAVMERTEDARVIPLDAGWSDVGAWSALWEVTDKDESGNVLKGDVLVSEASNSYLSASSRLVGVVGVDNIVVVETADAVLVADKGRVQEVKQIVNQLKAEQRMEAVDQVEVYRPWGSYESIDQGERFQVKHIRVKPGEKLSLQKHHHRAEHWVVVQGTAKVTRGEDVFLVSENQSTYIPIGETHRLENPGKIPLDLIEVQTGSYLGEDDIVRLKDTYGRHSTDV